MKAFELVRQAAAPFLPPLPWRVRRDLKALLRGVPGRPRVLDVGARRSPYTIGLSADVTLLDVPQETATQKSFDLGMRDVARLKRRRSNVVDIRIEDFLEGRVAPGFDLVVSVEVIEHVERDEAFVREIARVLEPGGVAYLTTPNGDFYPTPAPSHLRHYGRQQLIDLCAAHFDDVDVGYAIGTGPLFHRCFDGVDFHRRGFRPVQALIASGANVAYKLSPAFRRDTAERTAHLVAVLRRPAG